MHPLSSIPSFCKFFQEKNFQLALWVLQAHEESFQSGQQTITDTPREPKQIERILFDVHRKRCSGLGVWLKQ
jgi:hypothetical protein